MTVPTSTITIGAPPAPPHQEPPVHTLFTTLVHQQVAADRRHRYLSEAARGRRARHAAAPDLTRTADRGSSVLPVRSPTAAVRVGDTTDEPLAA